MKTLRVALICLVFLVVLLFFIRIFSHTELDDVHPGIQCDKWLIETSDVLWIIPFFNNISISENRQWINFIIEQNKTLGMHGVRHSYEEFGENRDSEYINMGIKIFEESFFEKSAIFKAPQLELNSFNKKLIENNGMSVRGKWNQIFHKVYHCQDTGQFPNWFVRLF